MRKINNQELISNYPNCTCINPNLNSNKPILCSKLGMYLLWFKFTSSSNFFKLVRIFQTGSYFLNQFIFFKLDWFIFFKLVHIFQTGLKFLNQLIFQF